MKAIKKVFAILLVVAMVMGLGVTAFAADNGSITISNPTTGQTYTAYKIFDLTYSYSKADYENGDTIYYTYNSATGTYSQYTGEGAPTGGTQLYVLNVAYTATEAQKTFYEKQTNNPFTFTTNTAETYNVSVGKKSDGTSYSDDEVIAFLQSFITTDSDGKVSVNSDFAAVIGTGVTGTAGTNSAGDAIVTISNLPYGYYFVTSTVGTVLTIDSTTPNVTVQDKNGKPDADKDVKEDSTGNYGDSNTAGIDETVEFRTKVTIPVGTVNLVLHDDMDTGLDLDADSIKVYTDENLQTALAEGNYTVKTSGFAEGDTCDFEVAFTSAYLNSLTTSTDVYVYYKATVNSSAVISGDGNGNKTNVSYGNNSDVTSTPSTTTTKVWEFDLYKYTADAEGNKTALTGAEFTLSLNGTALSFVYNEKTSTYTLATAAQVADTDTTTTTTITAGDVTIKGLDAGTYVLTETKAPEGYNSLNDTITVVIAEDGAVTWYNTKSGETTAAAVDGTNGLEVLNQSGTELPSTGGMGTTIFYVVGSILVIGAAVLLITKKRMNGTAE